jgi:ABC-type amino acid transport substrate-binding protein
VQTGFVISRLQEEFGDLREGRRQRVLAEGVRALDSEEEAAADGGTVCSVGPGEVCLVTARFRKVDPGLPGGRIDYAISYDTLVLTERAEPEEVQAASWAAGD